MIQIALCDDDKLFLREFHEAVLRWARQNEESVAMRIEDYSDSEFFLDSLREKSYDLVFLDIEMPRRDGIAVAKELHDKFPESLIVFLTSHSEFMEEGYEVRAFRYLNKLTAGEKLPAVLEAACRELQKRNTRCHTVQHYSDFIRIPIREIAYVRHILRYSEITLASGEKIKDGRGLKEILSQLEDAPFVQIDRGASVNLDYVRQIKGNCVLLSTGESLSISRQKLAAVKEAISRIWGNSL